MGLRKPFVLCIVIFFSFILVFVVMYLFSACDEYKNTKITKEYEHMIEVGDSFLVKEKQDLYLDENPMFLKGTKQEFRNLNKNHSLILGLSCYLVEGGYFKVTDLDCDADGRIKVSFIYYNSSLLYPENNLCPGGLKGWLYLNEFVSKVKR